MGRVFRILKTITVGVGLLSMVACGDSVEEQVTAAYEEGYSEGQTKGHSEAIDCVRNEGGGAEDAADSCE